MNFDKEFKSKFFFIFWGRVEGWGLESGGVGGQSKKVKLQTRAITEVMYTAYTLKCLSIGTPKAINFPFVSNEKLKFFRCPSIQAHCIEAVIYLSFGTPKNNEFSIWNKWKIHYFLVSQYLSTLG